METFDSVLRPSPKITSTWEDRAFNCYTLEVQDNNEYLKSKMSIEQVGFHTGDTPLFGLT